MSPFRRVAGDKAGPTALGILIPPGLRTLVLVRPRAMDWDLLLLKPGGNGFWEMPRGDAAALTPEVQRSLEGAAADGGGRMELIPRAPGAGYWVRAAIGRFTWLVCRRRSGQAYQAMTFATEADARAAAERLGAVLCPAAAGEQEIYFNTLHFTR
jgi:hypothetical protein